MRQSGTVAHAIPDKLYYRIGEVEAITSVQSEFKQILVVTHIQELKEMFPVQIEITKTPEGSMWALA